MPTTPKIAYVSSHEAAACLPPTREDTAGLLHQLPAITRAGWRTPHHCPRVVGVALEGIFLRGFFLIKKRKRKKRKGRVRTPAQTLQAPPATRTTNVPAALLAESLAAGRVLGLWLPYVYCAFCEFKVAWDGTKAMGSFLTFDLRIEHTSCSPSPGPVRTQVGVPTTLPH